MRPLAPASETAGKIGPVLAPPRRRVVAAALSSAAAASLALGCLDWDVGPFAPTGGADAGTDADAAPIDEGLVAHWTFDDGGGKVARDVSGGDHDGVLVGDVGWTAGRSGGAIAFTGAEGWVEAKALEGLAFPARGTLALWIESTFAGDFWPIFDNVSAERPHLALRNHVPGKVQFHARTADAGVAFNGIFDVPAGAWTHLVVVWDAPARAAAAYRDGAQVFSETDLPGDWTPREQEVTFGKKPGGGLVGRIDDVRLYDRPLGAAEIARLP